MVISMFISKAHPPSDTLPAGLPACLVVKVRMGFDYEEAHLPLAELKAALDALPYDQAKASVTGKGI